MSKPPRTGRKSQRFLNRAAVWQLGVWLTVFILGALMTASAFPGWMSFDSRYMFAQATGQEPITSHHTPWLTVAWSGHFPEIFGPTIPFLLQSLLFWISVGLLASQIARTLPLAGLLLPVLTFTLDMTWVLGWIWKDATSLSLGAFVVALTFRLIEKPSWRFLFVLLGAIGLMASVRWYLFPAILGLAVTLVGYTAITKGELVVRFRKFEFRNSAVTWLTSIAVLGGAFVSPPMFAQAVAGPIQPSFSSSHTLLWDLIRIECWTPGNTSAVAIMNAVDGPFLSCEGFDPVNAWSLVASEEQQLRFPTSEAEAGIVRDEWLSIAPEHVLLLSRDKLLTSIYLLRAPDDWVVPSYDIGSGNVSLECASEGVSVGFPCTGNGFLNIARLPSAVFNLNQTVSDFFQSGLIYAFLLPIAGLLVALRRTPLSASLAVGVTSFPVLWVLGFGAVSPWVDTRYIAVAVYWGLATFLYIMAKAKASPAARNSEDGFKV